MRRGGAPFDPDFSFPVLSASTPNTTSTDDKPADNDELPPPPTLRATVIDRTQPDAVPKPIAMPPPSSTVNPRRNDGRRKVVPYEKGFSQMDWMRRHMTEHDIAGLQGASPRRIISHDELAKHNTLEDCWMGFRGNVFNMTPYLRYHPGGDKILLSVAGKDGTAAFEKFHRWVNAPALVGNLLVGKLEDKKRQEVVEEEVGDGRDET